MGRMIAAESSTFHIANKRTWFLSQVPPALNGPSADLPQILSAIFNQRNWSGNYISQPKISYCKAIFGTKTTGI